MPYNKACNITEQSYLTIKNFFPPKQLIYLDLSYKTDLDFLNDFWKGKIHLTSEYISSIYIIRDILKGKKMCLIAI